MWTLKPKIDINSLHNFQKREIFVIINLPIEISVSFSTCFFEVATLIYSNETCAEKRRRKGQKKKGDGSEQEGVEKIRKIDIHFIQIG